MTILRADAERNRGLVLEAARSVFAERGIDAGVAEVAERAGVGVGTIFRRFPTKDDLLAAVVEDRVNEIRTLAETARNLREFMTAAAEIHIRDRCLCDCVGLELFERASLRQARDDVRRLAAELLERAQVDGDVREDVRVDDLPVILLGVARSSPPGQWRRYLEFALDGLRPL